jgi:hypothetical protein
LGGAFRRDLLDRVEACDHLRRREGERRRFAEQRFAGVIVSRFVPSSSSWASRSALLDCEIPSTATMEGDPDRDADGGEGRA